MDLTGMWQVAPLDAELNRSGADPDLDDSAWGSLSVPGHWATDRAFGNLSEPLLYRKQFDHPSPEPGRRLWLCLDGVMAQSEIWLDGRFVGDTFGYFVPHQFEITDALAAQDAHVLAIEVSCPTPHNGSAKTSVTGSFQAGELAPGPNPGGIWRPVRIERTGPVAIRHARTICTSATKHAATLTTRVVLDAVEATEIRIDTSVTGPDGNAAAGGAQIHTVARGENRLEWTTTIDDPSLWWPAALGEQPLYEVTVAVRHDNQVSDRRYWRTGLRKISVRDLVWRVNGERLFVKGVSLGPQSAFPGLMDLESIAGDLRSARDAGLDLVRVHGHVARPELYESADRQGILLWQDLPLVGSYATSTRKLARRIARDAVDLLGHHPSVALWCVHDEPNGPPLPEPGSAQRHAPSALRRLSRHLLPSWNRSVLDPVLRREIRSADPSRTVITRSGSLPLLTDLSTSDPHLWLGWHSGHYDDLGDLLRQWPRLGTFLSGFGSQSVAISEWDESAPQFPGAQIGAFDRYLPRKAYPDGRSWSHATRIYQAELLRHQIETIRKLKYRPAGGYCLMALSDSNPDGGFGILDQEGNRKPAFDAVADASAPIIVVAAQPPTITTPGATLTLPIHVINDLREGFDDARVVATVSLDSWVHRQVWEGRIDPDACVFVGSVSLAVPDITGPLTIDVTCTAGDRAASNRYHTVIIPASEALLPRPIQPRK